MIPNPNSTNEKIINISMITLLTIYYSRRMIK